MTWIKKNARGIGIVCFVWLSITALFFCLGDSINISYVVILIALLMCVLVLDPAQNLPEHLGLLPEEYMNCLQAAFMVFVIAC